MSQTSSNPAATAAATTTSSSIDNPRFPIVALDAEGKNYRIWASRMESVLKVGHMWNVVKARGVLRTFDEGLEALIVWEHPRTS
ncbi:uncharacterized protein EI90DRAFT_3131227 [Cantharellus anzutake]|uniref:uncharacterized protein n=1 Tax=Cantharellus anzutake TaxID=1750568 RepID=UPI00190708FA|nr:uncharacterized protein EI90DRAFT_3131227 [Cantharellus anzutake]KAF8321980.1 hypothetical protein EI90DRAFT_3131227 [Cantharellus anzutake]